MKWKTSLLIFASLLAIAACTPAGGTGKVNMVKPPAKATNQAPPLVVEEVKKDLSLGEIRPDIPQVKVALLVPLSGESAAVGNAMFDAATMALYDAYVATPSDQIKAQLVIIPKDTGVTSAETVKAAQSAIEQGATFIIGPLFGQSVNALKPLLKEKGVAMLSFSNNKAVASAGAYTFGFLPEQQVDRIAEHAYLAKMQRVALLAPNDAYGEKVRDTLSEIYIRKGGLLAPAELFAPSQGNIDAAVTRIVGAYNNTPEERRFQAIFIADSGPQMKNILKSLRRSNFNLAKIKLYGTGLIDDKELTKYPELHGLQFPGSPPELFEVFEKRFTTTYGYKPVRLAGLSYDAVTVAARIAMEGKGITQAALTNPNGFMTPSGGLVRLIDAGTSERRLNITEITPTDFKVIDRAQKTFQED